MHPAVHLAATIIPAIVGLVLLLKKRKEKPFIPGAQPAPGPKPRPDPNATPDTDSEQWTNYFETLAMVEVRLMDLEQMRSGRDRTRAIKALRALYHPDRNEHVPSMYWLFTEISKLINERTAGLLEEDRALTGR